MKIITRIVVILALILSQVQLVGAATATANTTTATYASLATVIANDWQKWTGVANGGLSKINYQNFSLNLESSSYSGEDAAALAAATYYMCAHKPRSVETNTIATDKNTLMWYKVFCNAIPSVTSALFTNADGKPHIGALQQGRSGDCFLFSAMGWYALHYPEKIVSYITTTPATATDAASYTVTFPSGKSATISAPTTAEMLYMSSGWTKPTIADGMWSTVIQKAVGTLLPDSKSLQVDDPGVTINAGNNIPSMQKVWNGANTTFKGSTFTQANVIKALKLSDSVLTQATGITNEVAPSLLSSHVYAVLAYNSSKQIIYLWNPHGISSTVTVQGPNSGYSMVNGIFEMSLSDFMQVFSVIGVAKNNI